WTADGAVLLDTKVVAVRKGMAQIYIIDIVRESPRDLPAGEYRLEVVGREVTFKDGVKKILEPVPAEVTLGRGRHWLIKLAFRRAEPDAGADKRGPAKGGWTQLFNGRDLTGWKTHPKRPGGWEAKDGLLVGRGEGEQQCLFSERADFEDFHLRLEAKINATGSAVLYFRSEFALDSKGVPPGRYDAELEDLAPDNKQIRADEWFTVNVVARGSHYVIHIDSQKVLDYTVEKSRHRKGHLVLQVLGGPTVIHFRKIEIKELPPAPPAVKEDTDWIPRFNRRDLSKWMGRFKRGRDEPWT